MKYEKKGKNTLLKLYGLKKLAPQDELRTGKSSESKIWTVLLYNIQVTNAVQYNQVIIFNLLLVGHIHAHVHIHAHMP